MSKVINIPLGQREEKMVKVVVGSHEFHVAIDPQSLEELANKCIAVGTEIENIDFKDMEQAKKGLKKGFNALLGKGAFKKIWAESGSVVECTQVLYKVSEQLVSVIEREVPTMTQAEKAKEYAKAYAELKTRKK